MAIVKNDPQLLAYRAERDQKKRRRMADKLVRENEPLVRKLVTKFSRFAPESVEFDDLMQGGFIAFMYAIDNIDTTKTFSTYLAFRVWYECSKIIEKAGNINHPRGSGMSFKILRKIEAFQAAFGRHPTAEELGVTEEKMRMWALMPTTFSMDAENGEGNNLHNVVVDDRPGPEQEFEAHHREQALLGALSYELTPGQYKILRDLLDGRDPKVVAAELNVPLAWVESTAECAVERLREWDKDYE